MTDNEFVIERKDEVLDFRSRHADFFERFPVLQNAINTAFSRRFRASTVADEVVFFLSRVCVDDFHEILLLLSNGFGLGGMKLLRGMFERAVTARYLSLHPDRAQDFLDYHWVALHKLRAAIESTWGSGSLLSDMNEEIETEFNRVRDRFMITDCRSCKTQRLNYSWAKLDLVSMAKEIPSLKSFVVPAYYLPIAHAHSTAQSFLRRLKEDDNAITYADGNQRGDADRTLMTSQLLLINVLDLQQTHFKIPGMETQIDACMNDVNAIWNR